MYMIFATSRRTAAIVRRLRPNYSLKGTAAIRHGVD